jgi:hypothetical protein
MQPKTESEQKQTKETKRNFPTPKHLSMGLPTSFPSFASVENSPTRGKAMDRGMIDRGIIKEIVFSHSSVKFFLEMMNCDGLHC